MATFVVLASGLTFVMWAFVKTRNDINEFMFKRDQKRKQANAKAYEAGKKAFDASYKDGQWYA